MSDNITRWVGRIIASSVVFATMAYTSRGANAQTVWGVMLLSGLAGYILGHGHGEDHAWRVIREREEAEGDDTWV